MPYQIIALKLARKLGLEISIELMGTKIQDVDSITVLSPKR